MQTKINIKLTNMELNNSINDRVNEKLEQLEKFMSLKENETPIADIELEKEFGQHHKNGQIYRAEINLQYRGKVFRTESTHENILNSVDEAIDEMIRRVRKSRERKIDLFRRGAKQIKKFLRFGKTEE